jgi:hypothetical protein
VGDLVHALTDADRGGQVIDRVDVLQGRSQCVAIAHVTVDAFDVRVQVVRKSVGAAVHLVGEGVVGPDATAVLGQQVGNVTSDEPGTAGDQHPRAGSRRRRSCSGGSRTAVA